MRSRMGRPSARSRTWDVRTPMAARTLGTSSLAGPSTPRILFVRARLDSLPSSAYSVSSLPCFHGPGNHQTSPRSTTGSERARESGTLLTISYSRQCADRRWQRTSDDQPVPNTNLGKKSGCPHETSSCACLAGSSVPDSLAPSPFGNKLTLSLTNYSYPHTTGFTWPSTYHYLNAGVGPQERAVERGVLSRNDDLSLGGNCHYDPIHLSSNHEHLHLITTVITTTIKAPATVHSPSDLVYTTWTLLLLIPSWVSTLLTYLLLLTSCVSPCVLLSHQIVCLRDHVGMFSFFFFF